MVDRNIKNPGQLHDILKQFCTNAQIASKATVYSYFADGTPQPWFIRALIEAFSGMEKPLSREEIYELQEAYFRSY